MRELTMNEVRAVSGGNTPTIVAGSIGGGTSLIIGAALGPVGVLVAGGVFLGSFMLTRSFIR
jgi:hypothetical protein